MTRVVEPSAELAYSRTWQMKMSGRVCTFSVKVVKHQVLLLLLKLSSSSSFMAYYRKFTAQCIASLKWRSTLHIANNVDNKRETLCQEEEEDNEDGNEIKSRPTHWQKKNVERKRDSKVIGLNLFIDITIIKGRWRSRRRPRSYLRTRTKRITRRKEEAWLS